jgi:hypothetical protein
LGWTLSAVTADMVAETVKQELTTIIQSPASSSILEQIQYAK